MDAKDEPGMAGKTVAGSEAALEAILGDKCEIYVVCSQGKSKNEVRNS